MNAVSLLLKKKEKEKGIIPKRNIVTLS